MFLKIFAQSLWMNVCLLVIDKVLKHPKSQGWDLNYRLNKAKANVSVVEGRIYKSQKDTSRQQPHFDLDAKDIDEVWKRCKY